MIQAMKNASAMALAFAFLVGCTKLGQQDPYAEKADDIRNGIPPATQGPKPPKPVVSDALRIHAQDYYSFKEGEEGKFTVTGAVIVPVNGQEAKYGQDFVIEVVNLADFPGAIWDEAKATLRWKPPEGFVDKEYSRNMRLLLRLTLTATQPIMVREQEVKVFVTRSEKDPEIISVENLKTYWTREGEHRKFTVVVKDPDSLDADKMRPTLMVVSTTQGALNAANLVYEHEPNWNEKNPMQDPLDPTKWIFTMILDLKDDQGEPREITKGLETFSFGLIAANRFGGSTAPVTVQVPIVTSIREPAISWLVKEPIEMVAGRENTFTFSAYDPAGEAKISAVFNRCDLLPGSPSCSCVQQDREFAQLCTIRWNPPATEIGKTIDVKGEVYAATRVQGDTIPPRKKPFTGRVKIVKPPEPVPQPNPAPAVPNAGGQ